jgi:carboxymethylenebutenolidase
MPALLALPARLPAPAVMVMNDIFGSSPFYDNITRRLAQAGFVALDPEFFFRQGALPERTVPAAIARAQDLDQYNTVVDLGEAIEWLKEQPEVAGQPVATLGFCMGGTFGLDLAVRDDIAATIGYYTLIKPRGLFQHEPPPPLELVRQMHGPILGHWGDQDVGVGIDEVEELRGALQDARVEHTFRIYPGIGHGFLESLLGEEGTPSYEAACGSWTESIEFCRRTLEHTAVGGR